jgi:hypothetical protein
VVAYIRDHVAGLKLEFIYFHETSLEDLSDKCLRMIDPNRLYLWDWLHAKGKSRGMLSGIKSDMFDVGFRRKGEFIL